MALQGYAYFFKCSLINEWLRNNSGNWVERKILGKLILKF